MTYRVGVPLGCGITVPESAAGMSREDRRGKAAKAASVIETAENLGAHVFIWTAAAGPAGS
jgi:hypothetical protein